MSTPFLAGTVIAQKYRVERVLGRGGMGIVLAARHVDLDEQVAIKVLVGKNPKAADARRFLREARTAAKVKNEHVCRVFDVGRLDGGEPYLVMEYLDGQDLAAKLAKEGPQRIHLVASWMIEICAALAEAHDLGIVHRDLKPANVFLARRKDGSSTKLLDFGVSTMASNASTDRGALMGTALYMAPEQLDEGREARVASDIWSLGVTMYELLSGRVPFEATSLLDLVGKIRNAQPVPLARLVPDLPVALGNVVDRCLAKDPAERFATASALAAALAPYAGTEARALATRLGRCVVRASDPFLAIDSGEIEEPTFPNSTDAVVATDEDDAAEPVAPVAPVASATSLGPVAGPATPRARGRWVLALAGIAVAASLLLLAHEHGARTGAQQTARAGAPSPAADDLPARSFVP